VTRLNRDDLRSCGQRLLRQVRRLAVITRNGDVLELDRRFPETISALGFLAEVEARLGIGSGSERALDRREMRPLMSESSLSEVTQLTAKPGLRERSP
jgi:hypothetical protein